jgi:flagellar biosynthesis anti-sigma factor FlgM
MRIDQFQQPQPLDSNEQVNRKAEKKAEPPSLAQQDAAKLSPQLQERLAQTPEVRQERITAIKQAMDAGTYNVSDSQLAGAMFNEFFKRG